MNQLTCNLCGSTRRVWAHDQSTGQPVLSNGGSDMPRALVFYFVKADVCDSCMEGLTDVIQSHIRQKARTRAAVPSSSVIATQRPPGRPA